MLLAEGGDDQKGYVRDDGVIVAGSKGPMMGTRLEGGSRLWQSSWICCRNVSHTLLGILVQVSQCDVGLKSHRPFTALSKRGFWEFLLTM